MLYITSDHAGLELKTQIIKHLKDQNFMFEDMGPFEFDKNDDYPDFVMHTMIKVQANPNNKAILICKNGIGVCMMANKFAGIRCGLSWNVEHAVSGRHDDDTNVLALPAGYIQEKTALEVVDAWLDAPFSNEERHIRRIQKVGYVLA